MGKMKLGSDCYLTADILTKVFQKCLFTDPLIKIYNVCQARQFR